MKTGLLLNKANPELSKAEAIRKLQPETTETDHNLLIIDKKPSPEELNKLALTKKAYQILTEASTEQEIEKKLLKQTIPLEKKNHTFKITSLNLLHKKRTPENLKGIAKALTLNPSIKKADMKNPDLEFTIIKAKKTYLALKIWENQNKYKERKPDKRPYNHPTSLDPRTARAMINLANPKKQVLDPFCGAGGILIEAGILGLETTGIDFDSRMIKRAKANTEHYNIKARLIHGNALDWQEKTECAVTDIPYGKNSRISEEINILTKKFLEKYSELTKTIVISHPNTIKIEEHAENTKLTKKGSYQIYIHKKLTRTITLFER